MANCDTSKYDKFVTSVESCEYGFMWVMNNFSAWQAQVEGDQESSVFPAGEDEKYQWILSFRPHSGPGETHYGMFVKVVKTHEKCIAKYDITMTDSNNCTIQQRSFLRTMGVGDDWGFNHFFEKATLLEKIKPGDVLIVKCKIAVQAKITSKFIDSNRNQLSKPVPSSFCSDLNALIDNNEKFGDVTVLVGGQRFLAYKGILAARSTVFAAMFESQMRENIESRITIDDLEPEVFKELLRYIYTDELNCLGTKALKLYIAADKYAIATLKSRCRYHILEKLCWETAAETLLVADLHDDEEMKSVALQFLSRSVAAKVAETDGWKEMVKVRPCLVDEVVRALAGAKKSSCLASKN